MNNEGLSNEWQENTPMKQEINPWLHRRLEERARPLNSRVVAVDKPTLISPSYQQLLHLMGKSNRTVESIVGRAGLALGSLQANKLSLFSKAFPGIISRTVSIGSSNLYKMMNLPWFRPKRKYKQESVHDSASISRQEMPEGNSDNLDDTVILPGTESVGDNKRESLGKTPETYINYMVSPPITRKTVVNINNQDRGTELNDNSPLMKINQALKTHNLIDVEKNNRDMPLVSRSTNQSMVNKEVLPDRFRIQQDNGTTITTGHSSQYKEDRDKGKVTDANEETKKTETIDYSSLHREEKETGQITAPEIDRVKPDISLKSEISKGNSVYPVNNLFYENRPSIIRKIARSLPFIRNIQRKEVIPSESINQPADQRRIKQNINYGHLDNPENMANYDESPSVTPVNTDNPVSSEINKTTAKDFTINQEFSDAGYESQSSEPQKLNKSSIPRETDIKLDTGLIYPVKDLFDRKSFPFGRRLIQSLPLVKNIQRKPILSSESVKQSIDQKQTEQSDNLRPLDTIESIGRYEVDARVYKPAHELPLISRSTTSKKSKSHQNDILSGDSSIAGPEFIIPVDNSLDLTLAPVNRMPAVQRQEEYPRIDQSFAEPMITLSTQETRTAGTQQSETSEETPTETQQSETSEQAAIETRESSTSSNENMLDYRTIARETYPFIRRMIMVERERRPSR